MHGYERSTLSIVHKIEASCIVYERAEESLKEQIRRKRMHEMQITLCLHQVGEDVYSSIIRVVVGITVLRQSCRLSCHN